MNKEILKQKADRLTLQQFISAVNRSEVRRHMVPQELVSGWPSISIKRGELCLTIPYYGIRKQKDSNRWNLYPISYTITATYKHARMVSILCLPYEKSFQEIDFASPCGTFKHAAIEGLSKKEYVAKREALYKLYDALIEATLAGRPFEQLDEMRKHFSVLMEPGQYPMYQRIAPNFFAHYCGELKE